MVAREAESRYTRKKGITRKKGDREFAVEQNLGSSVAKPRSVLRLTDVIQADPPDWLLLQYNPFSYGRWGLNLHLPLIVRRIKQQQPHIRIALMVHEPFVPIENWKFAIMTT